MIAKAKYTVALIGLGLLASGVVLQFLTMPQATVPPNIIAIASEPPTNTVTNSPPTATTTPVPTATSSIPWTGWATPLYPIALTPIPYPLTLDPDRASSRRFYVLFGSDFLPHRDSINTDVTMIVVLWLDEEGESHISLVSIPRDLYVFVPGFGMSRINSGYGIGGLTMAVDAIRYNFGIHPAGYALIDMGAFITLIDNLGGLDVEISQSIFDRCGRYSVNYLPGTYHMDGLEALCYARARKQSSDFDRLRRQQEVVLATFRGFLTKMGQDPVGFALSLFSKYEHIVQHNLNIDEVAILAVYAALTPEENVHLYRLVPLLITKWTKPDTGAYLLIPPPPECLRLLMELAQTGEPWPEACP